jgi:hypothetical protein
VDAGAAGRGQVAGQHRAAQVARLRPVPHLLERLSLEVAEPQLLGIPDAARMHVAVALTFMRVADCRQ